jgi:hypothetical protein
MFLRAVTSSQAGPVTFPTFYPGTSEQSAARVVSITQDGTTFSGIDFAMNAPPLGTIGGGNSPMPVSCCRLQGEIVMEDGSPVPGRAVRNSEPQRRVRRDLSGRSLCDKCTVGHYGSP